MDEEIVMGKLFQLLGYFPSVVVQYYTMLVVLLLVFIWFSKQAFKNEANNWLFVLNTLIAWVLLINTTIFTASSLITFSDPRRYEWYVFSSGSNFSIIQFVLGILIFLIPAALFLFKKFRLNIWITIFCVILLNMENLTQFYRSLFNRDYLPSKWEKIIEDSTRYKFTDALVFAVVLSMTYFVFSKWRKLPYSSILLK